MIFEIDAEQLAKIAVWNKEMDKKAIEQQRAKMNVTDFADLTLDGQHPYTGAIGGSLTYSFTHTSIGLVVKVHHALTGETLDVTDYASW
jgi:hypothetical protein